METLNPLPFFPEGHTHSYSDFLLGTFRTGLHMYAKSIGLSEECLGRHYGDVHDADLGDGDGKKPEQFLARQHYFPVFGTCWESLVGTS